MICHLGLINLILCKLNKIKIKIVKASLFTSKQNQVKYYKHNFELIIKIKNKSKIYLHDYMISYVL